MNRSLSLAGTALAGLVAGAMVVVIATSTPLPSGAEPAGAETPITTDGSRTPATTTPTTETPTTLDPPVAVTPVVPTTSVPPPTPPTPPADDGALRRGQTGERVRALQEQLRDLGYWLGTPDGSYGDLTAQAVMAFQKVNGLERDGVAGPDTLLALERASRPNGRSTSGNLVEVDINRQVLLVIRGGEVAWVVNASTGTEKPYQVNGRTELADTPLGRWTVSWVEDGIDWGELGGLYRPRYFHSDGIAVHGYDDVPAYPASHGCVRVANPVMDWIWSANVMPLGSSVWVY